MKILQTCLCLFILVSITSSASLHMSYATENREYLPSIPLAEDGIIGSYEVRGSIAEKDTIVLVALENDTKTSSLKGVIISVPEVITEGIPFFISVKTNTPASVRIVWNKKNVPFSQNRKEKEYNVDAMLVLPISKYKPSVPLVITIDGIPHQYTLRAVKSAYTLVKRSGSKNISFKNTSSNPSIKKGLQQRNRLLRTVSPKRYWERGVWAKPVIKSSVISNGFGRTNVYNGKRQNPHEALDFSGKVGDPIYATSAGKVVFVGSFYFLGKTIYINHGQGVFSGYSSLRNYDVKLGDIVTAGQKIATMGQVTPKHKAKLHFALFSLGENADPTGLFN